MSLDQLTQTNQGYLVHPSAFVEAGAQVGANTKIWHNAQIRPTAKIGQNCNIGKNCFVAGIIGNNCKLQNNVNLYQGVELADYVFCGPSMTFTNDLNPRVEYPKQGNYIRTTIEKGVSIGANATIVCGITIGQYAMIGAGSVVTKDVPPFALVYGNPAQQHGWVNQQGEKVNANPLK